MLRLVFKRFYSTTLGVRSNKSHLKMGIVGLPNVGKTTLFNAITHSAQPAENFPFCTIDPAVNKVSVPDSRLDTLFDYYKPKTKKEAFLTVTDIAGLVKGASKGEGLGNAFLSNISTVDGIYHVIRGFGGNKITHVEGSTDVLRDVNIIEDELRFKDLETVDRLLNQSKRKGKSTEAVASQHLLGHIKELLDNRKIIQSIEWSPNDIDLINSMGLLTSKPIVYLLNISDKEYENNDYPGKAILEEHIKNKTLNATVVPFCAEIEEMIVSMGKDGEEYIKSNQFNSALPSIIRNGFEVLGLMQYFTVGPDEVRAWPVRKGVTAPQASACIHTDFEKAFQQVEVVKYKDFLLHKETYPTFKPLKFDKFGKKYIVEDGDILQFLTTLKK